MARPYTFNPSCTVNIYRDFDPDGAPFMTVPAMQMTPWLSFDEEITTWGRQGYIHRFLVSPTVGYIAGYIRHPTTPYRLDLVPSLQDVLTVVDAWPIMDGAVIHCWLVHAVYKAMLIPPTPPPVTTVLSAPIGMVMAYAPVTVLTGWEKCWGQAISRLAYPALFSLISTNFGEGDGSTTYNLPDLRSRSIVGDHHSPATGFMLGVLGGNATTTLIIANLPPHGHQMPFSVNLGSSGTVRLGDAGTGGVFTTGLSTGASLPFSNWHPYQVVPYLIKVYHVDGTY